MKIRNSITGLLGLMWVLIGCQLGASQDWREQLLFPPQTDHELAVFIKNVLANDSRVLWTDEMRASFAEIENGFRDHWKARRMALHAIEGITEAEKYSDRHLELSTAYNLANDSMESYLVDNLTNYSELLGDQIGLVVDKWNTQQLAAKAGTPELRSMHPKMLRSLSEQLGLSEEQLGLIDGVSTTFDGERTEIQTRFLDAMSELEREKFELMVAQLQSDQKEEFDDLIGQPIRWYQMRSDKRLRLAESLWKEEQGLLNKRRGRVVLNSEKAKLALSNGNRDELKELGFSILDDFWYDLMRLKPTRDELDMTDDQCKQLSQVLAKLYSTHLVTNRFSKSRLESLLDQELKLPEEVSEIFVADQLVAMRQVELQLRMYREFESYTLLNKMMAKKLDLTNKQKQRIEEIRDEYRPRIQEIFQRHQDELGEVAERQRGEMLTILKDDQIEFIENATGIKFKKR